MHSFIHEQGQMHRLRLENASLRSRLVDTKEELLKLRDILQRIENNKEEHNAQRNA